MQAKRQISSPADISFVPVAPEMRSSVLREIFMSAHKTMNEIKKERQTADLKKTIELLSDIAKEPFRPLTARRSLSFGNSTSDLFRVKDKAVQDGYAVQVVTKATRGPGQKGIYLELSRKGIDLLMENGLWKRDKPYYKGKMGFAGALLINGLLLPYFEESGHKALIEGIDKGYDCDIGVVGIGNERELAVELSVYTSAKQELLNITRDFGAGWKKVLCIVAAFERKEEEATESEMKTREKAKNFKEYFEIHLSADELKMTDVRCISEFRKKARNE